MNAYKDYYSLLQVHSEADQDIVEATYKKLCKKYHPDICSLPEAEELMKQINSAYDVIGDPVKRKLYNTEYKKNTQARQRATWFGPGSTAAEEQPRKLLESYMLCLSSGLYHDAYELLSQADKKFIELDKFVSWQRLVGAVYQIKQFTLRSGKRFEEFMIEGSMFECAYRFDIELAELSRLNDVTRNYIIKKFVVSEGGKWRVYLGYKDLTEIMNEFQYLASCQNSPETLSEWKSYRSKIDSVTGLYNRAGLLEHALPDAYRYERYDLGFYVALVQVKAGHTSDDFGNVSAVYAKAGQCIRNTLRCGDTVACVGPGRFACILLKANRKNCKPVLARLANFIARDCMMALDMPVSVHSVFTEYAGDGLEATLVACEKKLLTEL